MIVYKHIRLDTNEVFYIGIGKTKKRAFYKYGRNSHWKNIVNKVEYSVEIVTETDTWEKACQIEQYLIKFYGRYDLGTGNLVNKTDGGEGVNGFNHSEKTKKQISKSKKGCNNLFKGTKYTKDRALKCSSLHKKDLVILNLDTGIFYETIKEVAETYNFKRTTLNAMLSGQNKNKTNIIII